MQQLRLASKKFNVSNYVSVNAKQKANIVNPQILQRTSYLSPNQRPDLYEIVGKQVQNVAFMELNYGHKNNILTNTMVKELDRFLRSYELDENIRAVWLESSSENGVFSKGLDLKYVFHNAKNNQKNQAYDYLQRVNNLSSLFAQYNKPVISNLNGLTLNTSASLFSTLPFSVANKDTRVGFNATQLGFVPFGGTSYILSRLDNELGLYLAMTGQILRADDLINSGLLFGYVSNEAETKYSFIENNLAYNRLMTSEQGYGDQYKEYKNEINQAQQVFYQSLANEIQQRIDQGENTKFVIADVFNRRNVVEQVNQNQSGRFKFKQDIMNNLQYYRDNILKEQVYGYDLPHNNKNVSLPMDQISKCFSGNSVEEIVERLESLNTDFAKETLKKLQQNSVLSLKLTYQLIRNAVNLQFHECLEQEYRVAARRINDSEFQDGIEKMFFNNKNPAEVQWKYNALSQVSDAQVESYFRPLQEDLKIEEYTSHNIKENSLYPVKFYYDKYPDTIRYYLNEKSLNDMYLREGQIFDVQHFLLNNGIDYRNNSLQASVVRKRIFLQEELNRKNELEVKKVKSLSQSEESIQSYFSERQKVIDEKFSDSTHVNKIVEQQIQKIFDKYFQERIEKVQNLSQNAQYHAKKQFYENLKQQIIESRLLTDQSKLNEEKLNAQFSHLQNAQPFFQPTSDAQSWLEANPLESIEKNSDLKRVYEQIKLIRQNSDVNVLGNSKKNNLRDIIEDRREFQKQLLQQQYDRYGIPKEEKIFLANYNRELLDIAKQNEEVSQFLASNFQNDEELLKFLNEQKIVQEKQQNLYDESKELSEMISSYQGKLDQTIQQVDKTQAQLEKDLQQKQKEFNAQSQNYNQIQNMTVEQNENFKNLTNYVNQFQDLQELLAPILNKNNNSAVESLRLKFENLLGQVYKFKCAQTLENEKYKFNLTYPLLTLDGKKKHQVSNQPNLKEIDQFIEKHNNLQFHQMIESRIFFTYSYLALLEIEDLFLKLSNVNFQIQNAIKKLNTENPDAEKNLLSTIQFQLKKYKIFINQQEDLEEIKNYLNDVSEKFCALFYIFKDQIFDENEKIQQLLIDINQHKSNLSNRKSALQFLIQQYQDNQATFIEKYYKQFKTIKEKKPFYQARLLNIKFLNKIRRIVTQNIKNLQQNNQNDEIEKLEKELDQTLTSLQGNQNQKELVSGFYMDLKKLDTYIQRAINGQDNYLPDSPLKGVDRVNIPETFGRFDQRQNAQQWLEDAITEQLEKMFKIRYAFEKDLPNNQLRLLDLQLLNLLEPNNLKASVEHLLQNDVQQLRTFKSLFRQQQVETEKVLTDVDYAKEENEFAEKLSRKNIRNPEALDKYLAFGIVQHQKMQENLHYMGSEEYDLDQETKNRLYQEIFQKNTLQENERYNLQEVYRQVLNKPQIDNSVNYGIYKDNLKKETYFAIREFISQREKEQPQSDPLRDEELDSSLNQYLNQIKNKLNI